jgi:GcrA cell cycle regulator
MSLWSEERIDLLKHFRAAGRSAGQIAALLGGVTRNAVIGKLHRLGVPTRLVAGSNKPAVPRPDRKRAFKEVSLTKKFPPASLATYDQAIAFEDLARHHCRWPIDGPHGRRYCGDAICKDGPAPYCSEHLARAYVPLARKTGPYIPSRYKG